MIRNYIFDFGNVLFRSDTTVLTRRYAKREEDRAELEAVVFDRLYWDALDRGAVTDEAATAAMRERLPARLHDAALAVYNDWMYNYALIDGMEDVLREVTQRGGRRYLLSNISRRFAQCWRTVPAIESVLSGFDGLVFSGPLGIVKPDPAIFCYLLTTYGLSPQECFFVDDLQDNCDAALRLGIRAYRFEGDAASLLAAIRAEP